MSSNKNLSKETPVSPQLDTTQTEPSKLPSLLMTPILTENSIWPSYIIKPIYNNYFDTANNLTNNISSYVHTYHVTPIGTQIFPVMPYYVQSKKVGETNSQVIYPLTSTFYNYQNLSIPIFPTLTPIVRNIV